MYIVTETKYQFYISEKPPQRRLENTYQRTKLKERDQLKYYNNLACEKIKYQKGTTHKERKMEERNDSGWRDGEEEIQF